MTDEQKAVMKWLDYAETCRVAYSVDHKNVTIIKAMLVEPRLPKEPTETMFRAFLGGGGWVDCSTNREYFMRSWRALYAHLTKPATKTVEVWRVEFARMGSSGEWLPDSTSCGHASGYFTRAQAEEEAAKLAQEPSEEYACIRVTGPHKQDVPA